jgi:hypothetical protein
MINLSIREIKNFSRLNTIHEKFLKMDNDKQKQFLLDQLKYVNWYKSIDRLEYNTYLFYKNIGFDVNLEIIDSQYFIKFDNCNIKIRVQDYFFIKFINKLKKRSLIKKWFNNDYLNYRKILVEYPINTHNNNKSYRVDYLLHISGNNYICLEFFEKAHKSKDDPDFKKEKNRIYSLLNDSDDRYKKILFFAIYWEEKLDDKKYFNKFIKNIYEKIKELQDIENEKIWCANGINKFISSPELSNLIYDAYINDNIPTIPFSYVDSIIEFKDEESKINHKNIFKNDIDEFNDFELNFDNLELNANDIKSLDESTDSEEPKSDVIVYYKDEKLTLKGLSYYLNVKKEYFKNISVFLENRNIYSNIMKGIVYGLKKQRDLLINLESNKIIGLYDY